jgi:hypothetical protein
MTDKPLPLGLMIDPPSPFDPLETRERHRRRVAAPVCAEAAIAGARHGNDRGEA